MTEEAAGTPAGSIGGVSWVQPADIAANVYIIEDDSKWFIVTGLLEYDPVSAVTQEQQQAVAEVARLCNTGRSVTRAARISAAFGSSSLQATHPPKDLVSPTPPGGG